jgi:hypothetical protein
MSGRKNTSSYPLDTRVIILLFISIVKMLSIDMDSYAKICYKYNASVMIEELYVPTVF